MAPFFFIMTELINSYAKLNLNLLVGPARQDGYHPIQSVFQEISLHDVIHISWVSSSSVTLVLSSSGIEMPTDESNILVAVFEGLKDKLRHKYTLHVEKNIPLGSGMGGASSNAAAFIKAINRIEQLGLTDAELCHLGAQYGADIPFFIVGGSMKVEGIGEKLSPVPSMSGTRYVIMYPGLQCSTATIYSQFDTKVRTALSDSYSINAPYLGPNDLQDVCLSAYPAMRAIYDTLTALTHRKWRMTGSGSTFFMPLSEQDNATTICNAIKAEYPNSLVQEVTAL